MHSYVRTQHEDNVDEALCPGTFEKCAELQDKKHSFLDAATAIADIDTIFCS